MLLSEPHVRIRPGPVRMTEKELLSSRKGSRENKKKKRRKKRKNRS